MNAYFASFTRQIPSATLNVIDHAKHVDQTIAFTRDQSSNIEVTKEVKKRYGLSTELEIETT